MKKVLYILICGLTLLTITGCSYSDVFNNKDTNNKDSNVTDNKNEPYLICELATESNEEDDTPNTDYEHMNVSELKAIAKQRKIKGYYRLKRKDLLRVLK